MKFDSKKKAEQQQAYVTIPLNFPFNFWQLLSDLQVCFEICMRSDKSHLLTTFQLYFRDMIWAVAVDLNLRRLPDIEDGQRLGRAVVRAGPGPGLLCLYSTDPRHLVWHRATSSGLGPGLQLQNIPAQSETIIRLRQVPSGEDLTLELEVTGRTFVLSLSWSCMLYCLTHVFIPLWLFAEFIMKVLDLLIWYSSCLSKLVFRQLCNRHWQNVCKMHWLWNVNVNVIVVTG